MYLLVQPPTIKSVLTSDGFVSSIHQAILQESLSRAESLSKFNPKCLENETKNGTPLHLAVSMNNEEMVEMLLNNGAKVDAKAKIFPNKLYNQTPLHIAIDEGNYNIVLLLLKAGANVHATAMCNISSIHMAANSMKKDAIQIMELLIAYGANLEQEDLYNKTPLHHAAGNGSAEMIECLVKNKANIEAKDMNGKTPLHLAVQKMFEDNVAKLIELGANVKTVDKWQASLLHLYTKVEPSKKVLKLLLENNVPIDGFDNSNQTPLHAAICASNKKLVSFFVKHGANVCMRVRGGKAALDIAQENYERFTHVCTVLHIRSEYKCDKCKEKKCRAKIVKLLTKHNALPAKHNDDKIPHGLSDNKHVNAPHFHRRRYRR